ncbi:hypothetical protein CCMSSC00406_0003129 [Pleurotus cornucopiae]|uniref:Uncharacterized protein n=1 Tax=Pleurotus cornucopiae TaxID=5321 RepID=A0ACB7J6B6_PLECO|nr:hypothetical protein CCMSSC00406_0003129 [Pleurotus cornucopiae]
MDTTAMDRSAYFRDAGVHSNPDCPVNIQRRRIPPTVKSSKIPAEPRLPVSSELVLLYCGLVAFRQLQRKLDDETAKLCEMVNGLGAADQRGEVLWDSIVYIPDGIIRDLNIPEELHECVQVSEVLQPDGTRQAALCQIAQRVFDGKDPQWYLDPWQWQWTRKGVCSIIYGSNFGTEHARELSTVRILSPEEAKKWAADMNAREAALAGMGVVLRKIGS